MKLEAWEEAKAQPQYYAAIAHFQPHYDVARDPWQALPADASSMLLDFLGSGTTEISILYKFTWSQVICYNDWK